MYTKFENNPSRGFWVIALTPLRAAGGGRRAASMKNHNIPRSFWLHRTLLWLNNGRDGVSNHQPHNYLPNRLLRCRSKKHQSSTSLAFVQGIHRWPVNSRHKWLVTRKMFPFDDQLSCQPPIEEYAPKPVGWTTYFLLLTPRLVQIHIKRKLVWCNNLLFLFFNTKFNICWLLQHNINGYLSVQILFVRLCVLITMTPWWAW